MFMAVAVMMIMPAAAAIPMLVVMLAGAMRVGMSFIRVMMIMG